MDLKQLEYFVHVAELGSFTKAAALLGVAQPALSRQVRRLELELKQVLLLRTGRGASVTEAGKCLLAHGRGILHQFERAREDVDGLKGAPVGRVAVGMPPTVAKLLAVRLVKEFRIRLPRATLSIVEGLSDYMHEWLQIGRIDVALLYNPVPSPSVETTPLLEEDLFLIGPKRSRTRGQGRPVALRELASYPLIIPTRPHAIRMQVETELAKLGMRPTVALEIDGVAAILELVASGHGFAVLTLNAVRASGAPQAYLPRPILRPRLRSRLALAVSAQRPSTPIQRATLSLIQDFGLEVLAPSG
jgi:LysR family transcriptional regulator, nitrogen assimilation regulatory protein